MRKIVITTNIMMTIFSFIWFTLFIFYLYCLTYYSYLNGIIYYCDTDSIVTDIEIKCGEKLGEIKNEIPEGIEEAIFLSPKMYGIKTKKGEFIKCKGFPRKMFHFFNFKKAYYQKYFFLEIFLDSSQGKFPFFLHDFLLKYIYLYFS